MTRMNGGCACGKARYSMDAAPAFVAICHCKACQKASGSAFAVVVAVPRSSLSFQGNVTTFDTTGDSGKGVHYRFCADCGSPIASNIDLLPDLMMVRGGTLDDPTQVTPGMEIYCDNRQPWLAPVSGLAQFARMPG